MLDAVTTFTHQLNLPSHVRTVLALGHGCDRPSQTRVTPPPVVEGVSQLLSSTHPGRRLRAPQVSEMAGDTRLHAESDEDVQELLCFAGLCNVRTGVHHLGCETTCMVADILSHPVTVGATCGERTDMGSTAVIFIESRPRVLMMTCQTPAHKDAQCKQALMAEMCEVWTERIFYGHGSHGSAIQTMLHHYDSSHCR
jgi:hypothetical protein